jgi:hypothetical protein
MEFQSLGFLLNRIHLVFEFTVESCFELHYKVAEISEFEAHSARYPTLQNSEFFPNYRKGLQHSGGQSYSYKVTPLRN